MTDGDASDYDRFDLFVERAGGGAFRVRRMTDARLLTVSDPACTYAYAVAMTAADGQGEHAAAEGSDTPWHPFVCGALDNKGAFVALEYSIDYLNRSPVRSIRLYREPPTGAFLDATRAVYDSMCDLGVPLHEGLAADFRMLGRQFDTSAQLPEHHSEARRVRRYNLAQYAGAIRGDALAGYEDEQKSIMAGFGCLPTMHAELCECCLLMAGNETRVRWSRATHWSLPRAVRQTKRSQLLLTSGRGMPVLNGDVWNHIFSFLLDGEHVKDRAERLATWEAYDMSAAESSEYRAQAQVGGWHYFCDECQARREWLMDDLDGAVNEWLVWRRTPQGDVVDRLSQKCANPRCKKPPGAARPTCRACRTVSYCSKECQLEHWKVSKRDSVEDMLQASWTSHKSRCHAIRRRKPFERILALPESGRKGQVVSTKKEKRRDTAKEESIVLPTARSTGIDRSGYLDVQQCNNRCLR